MEGWKDNNGNDGENEDEGLLKNGWRLVQGSQKDNDGNGGEDEGEGLLKDCMKMIEG